jgi:hypothetical protein
LVRQKVIDGRAEALFAVNPGDGVLAAGGDRFSNSVAATGERLRSTDPLPFCRRHRAHHA